MLPKKKKKITFYFRIIVTVIPGILHFEEFKRMNKLLHGLQTQTPTATIYLSYLLGCQKRHGAFLQQTEKIRHEFSNNPIYT